MLALRPLDGEWQHPCNLMITWQHASIDVRFLAFNRVHAGRGRLQKRRGQGRFER